MLRKAGLYKPEALRPARELWLDSRCVLGRLLDKEIKWPDGQGKSSSRPENGFSERLKQLGLDKTRASESHRMGKMRRW